MPKWNDKRIARRVLSWKTEKGQDISINHITPLLASLIGKVLEIGPGSGNLLKYLPNNIQYSCIEPNPYLHESIRKEAKDLGFREIKIIKGVAEKIPLESNSVDAVISVRSMCSMDTAIALQEIKRVLKDQGRFVFVEHVGAPKASSLWFVQKLIKYPHKALRGGCDPSIDIESLIRRAGFAEIKLERFEVDRDLAKSRIAGVAIK